jgi:hypothetical protein
VDGLGATSSKDIYAELRESDEGESVFTKFDKESVPSKSQEEVDITFQFPESQNEEPFRENSFYSNFSSSSEDSEDSWLSDNAWVDEDGRSGGSRMSRTMSGIYDKAEKTVNATTGIIHSVVKKAPILNTRYDTFVHTGFWDAYMTVRDFIHTTLRQELAQRPAHVMCTGHSLGGALATLACLDVSLHTIPRVNAHLSRLREAKRKHAAAAQDAGAGMNENNMKGKDSTVLKHKYIKCTVYIFGSPRIGKHYGVFLKPLVYTLCC